MAVLLNTTISDEYANSYIDVNYADDYWEDGSTDTLTADAWSNLSDYQKTIKLVQACRIVETLHFTEPVDPLADYHLVYDSRNQQIRSVKTNYGRPQKYNYYQHLQFPRTLDVRMNGDLFIPEEIKMAQADQAGFLINFDPTIIGTRLQGVEHDSINVGGISLAQKLGPNGSAMSPIAYQFCKPYLLRGTMRIQRA